MKTTLIALLSLIPLLFFGQIEGDSTKANHSKIDPDSLRPLDKNEYSTTGGHFLDHGKNMPTFEFSLFVAEGITDVELRIELIVDDKIHPQTAKWHTKGAMDVDARGALADFKIHHEWKFPTSGLEKYGDLIMPLHVRVDRPGWIPVSIGIHGRKGHTTLVVWMGKSFLAEYDLAGYPAKNSSGEVICHVESNDAHLVDQALGMVSYSKLEGHEFPEMRTETVGDFVTLKWWVLNSEGLTFFHVYEVDDTGLRRKLRMIEGTNPKLSKLEVSVEVPEKGKWLEVDLEEMSGAKVIGEYHPWD